MINKYEFSSLDDVTLVVLAGGLGTRLKSVVADRPKILAQIDGQPFLALLLSWIVSQGVKNVSFSLGYMSDLVVEQLQFYSVKYPININYVIESEPLGTLGGLSLALDNLETSEIIVINGDTFVEVNLSKFMNKMKLNDSAIGLVATRVESVSRYGQVIIDDTGSVTQFIEKNPLNNSPGWINAGVYYFSSDMADKIRQFSRGSIEHDFLIPHCEQLQSFQISSGCFIDIGTPESYQKAPVVLKDYIK